MKNFAPGVFDPATLEWELYYPPDDFARARNFAAEQPGKIAELNDLWWAEAEKFGALPLLGEPTGNVQVAMDRTGDAASWPWRLFRARHRPRQRPGTPSRRQGAGP